MAGLSGQKENFDRFFEEQAKEITERSVTAFESALDAASLIFSHSLLDTAAFDWCRVCALACPDDFMRYIGNRQFTLAEVQAASFSELREKAIGHHLETLEKESLLKKLDFLFALKLHGLVELVGDDLDVVDPFEHRRLWTLAKRGALCCYPAGEFATLPEAHNEDRPDRISLLGK